MKRPKDIPHIEILTRYLEQEVRERFGADLPTRDRIAPAKRFLSAFKLDKLPEPLASELIPLASAPALRRFLANAVGNSALGERLVALAHDDDERAHLRKVLSASGA